MRGRKRRNAKKHEEMQRNTKKNRERTRKAGKKKKKRENAGKTTKKRKNWENKKHEKREKTRKTKKTFGESRPSTEKRPKREQNTRQNAPFPKNRVAWLRPTDQHGGFTCAVRGVAPASAPAKKDAGLLFEKKQQRRSTRVPTSRTSRRPNSENHENTACDPTQPVPPRLYRECDPTQPVPLAACAAEPGRRTQENEKKRKTRRNMGDLAGSIA